MAEQNEGIMSIEELAKTLRELASVAFRTDGPIGCCRTDDGQSCLMIEENRPLTRPEKTAGWARRPFWAYDPSNLCNGCAIYWHIERAAQAAHEATCWKDAENRLKATRVVMEAIK
jgi:hypothetical protein